MIPGGYQLRLRVARELLRGEPEIRLLPTLLSGGGTFIDVGANLGTYSGYACRFTDSVEVFEPHPTLSAALREILGERASVHDVALSDRQGTVVFHIPVLGTREIHSRGSIENCHAVDFAEMHDVQVECRRLDDFEFVEVALIKIDVEGHELAVLRGGVRTLEMHRPSVIVELEEFRMPGSFDEVCKLMRDLRYRGFHISRGKIKSLDGFDISRHQSLELRQGYGEKRKPDFVNNFVFQHEDSRSPLRAGMKLALRGVRTDREAA